MLPSYILFIALEELFCKVWKECFFARLEEINIIYSSLSRGWSAVESSNQRDSNY